MKSKKNKTANIADAWRAATTDPTYKVQQKRQQAAHSHKFSNS